MDDYFGTRLLVAIFVVVFAESTGGKVYYMSPTLNGSCPQDPCLTLSQFASSGA